LSNSHLAHPAIWRIDLVAPGRKRSGLILPTSTLDRAKESVRIGSRQQDY
jgi:hypothetical protein